MSNFPTRAISLHAPFAWALMFAGKDVENRSKGFPRQHTGEAVMGRVWVHASLWPTSTKAWWPDLPLGALDKWRAEVAAVHGIDRVSLRGSHNQVTDAMFAMRGHIVGSIEVTGYRTPDDPPDSHWYVPGSLAIMVRDPRPLAKPVPAKGALGWWSPPPDVMALLEAAA
jgi:hypothetical protein